MDISLDSHASKYIHCSFVQSFQNRSAPMTVCLTILALNLESKFWILKYQSSKYIWINSENGSVYLYAWSSGFRNKERNMTPENYWLLKIYIPDHSNSRNSWHRKLNELILIIKQIQGQLVFHVDAVTGNCLYFLLFYEAKFTESYKHGRNLRTRISQRHK